LMDKDNFSLRLECPYCDELLPSHRALRVHIGRDHKEKTDEFMEKYFGGRWIEVDFISLMLRKSVGGLSEESCLECGGCDVACPVSVVHEGFRPFDVSLQLLEGKTREILSSDVLWGCTSCYACGQDCRAGMPPYDVIETLMNLSARTGYHFPRKYKEYDRSILRSGVIQRPGAVKMADLTRLAREDVGLPKLPAQPDLNNFKEAIRILADMRGLQ
jgi:heterodisulfide reductase subunit C